jgi:hypothetical protein
MARWHSLFAIGTVVSLGLGTGGAARAQIEIMEPDASDEGNPTNKGVDVRFHAHALRDLAQNGLSAEQVLGDESAAAAEDLSNVQINDPSLETSDRRKGCKECD